MIIQDEMLRSAVARTLQMDEGEITEKKLEELTTGSLTLEDCKNCLKPHR